MGLNVLGHCGPGHSGWAVADPVEIFPFPTWATLPNLAVLVQTILSTSTILSALSTSP